MRPTGNCRPALVLLDTAFLAVLPLPRPDMVAVLLSEGGSLIDEHAQRSRKVVFALKLLAVLRVFVLRVQSPANESAAGFAYNESVHRVLIGRAPGRC